MGHPPLRAFVKAEPPSFMRQGRFGRVVRQELRAVDYIKAVGEDITAGVYGIWLVPPSFPLPATVNFNAE
jgi:hypothetical protein